MTGKDFKIKRVTLGLSQKDLADKFGIQPNTISRYETGDLTIPKTVELAFNAIEFLNFESDLNLENEHPNIKLCMSRVSEITALVYSRESNGWGMRTIERTEFISLMTELFKLNRTLISVVFEKQNELPTKTMAYNFPLQQYTGGVNGLISLLLMTKEFKKETLNK